MTAATVRGAALWSVSAQVIAFSVQFAVSVLLSRFFLSPAEMGLYSIALSAAMMVSILQDFGISRFVMGQPELGPREIRTCFSVSLIFALAIGLVILALAWPLGAFYGEARLTPLLVIVAGSYLIVPFGIVPGALLQRAMDWRSMFAVNVGAAAIGAVVALGLAAGGWSAQSLAWSLVAHQLARALIGGWRAKIGLPFPLNFDGAGPVLRFGSSTSLLYISSAIGTRSPELIIGRLLDFAAVGLFGRASSLTAQLQQLVAGAVDGVFYPAFARLRDEGAPLGPPYQRVVAAYSAVTWPAMAFLAAVATPLVLMLYGPRWAGVATLLAWIAVAQCFFAALPLHVELPLLLGKTRRLLLLNFADTAVSIGLLFLASWWSLEWAAASRLAYGAVWFAIYIRMMRDLTGFSPRALAVIYAQSLAATLATIAPVLVAFRLVVSPAAMGLAAMAACALLGCLGWLAAIFVVRHPVRHEVAAIAGGALDRLRRRKPRPLSAS